MSGERSRTIRFTTHDAPIEVRAGQRKSLSENARFFALLGMALADGANSAFDNNQEVASFEELQIGKYIVRN